MMQKIRVSAWVLALGICAAPLHGQVIQTVAGTDPSFPISSIQALSAPLGPLEDVAVDAQGNLYASDSANNIVVWITPNGVLTVVAGNGKAGFSGDGGPATSASLSFPSGVAIDSDGNLYIADENNSRIRKVSSGTIMTVAGNGKPGFSGDGGAATSASLCGPSGVAIDSAGILYIADTCNNRIRRVSGGWLTTGGGNGDAVVTGDGVPATSSSLKGPSGVSLDSAGDLYIADEKNSRIRKVSSGTITTVAGNGSDVIDNDGDGPAASVTLYLPWRVAVDSFGNLYIAEVGSGRIRKVSSGTITTVAGKGQGFSGDGGPATSASLFHPYGVAVDSAGNVYIADTYNYRIRKVSGGTITTVAGNGGFRFSGDGGPATSASFNLPQGMAVDSAGNLYIADTYNNRIRKVSGKTITTIAGGGNALGDGGPATSASLFNPNGVAVDSAGNLYIADSGNSRIRKVSGGTIITVAGGGNALGDGGPATNASLFNP